MVSNTRGPYTLCLQARGSRRLVRKAALLGDGMVTRALAPSLTNPTVFTALQTAPALSMAEALKHRGACDATWEGQQSQELTNLVVYMNPGLTSPIPQDIASII